MKRRIQALAVLMVLAVAVAGCEGGGPPGTGPSETLIVGVDLPFQGAWKDASDDTWNALQLYLEQIGAKAGPYTVHLRKQDDSTAAKGTWDDATCTRNANEAVATKGQVAVLGTYNSGCAKLQLPILNAVADGPMLMVSHANTNPGLTKAWDEGEPDKYFPSGKRNYARVVTTDDMQGPAAAQFAARELNLRRCLVLNDTETYGVGVAKAFADEARRLGIAIVAEMAWRRSDPNYVALFSQAKPAGVDCVFLGGIYDNIGGQLTRDKVAVLGNNDAVTLIATVGFTGYPDFLALPEAAGTYLTLVGLPTDPMKAAGGNPAAFIAAYERKYGTQPRTSYALYGVQALQVILAAIEKSDGTRKGVRDAVFTGAGITISADKAVLGQPIAINPATGDSNVRDVSIEQVRDGKEIFHMAWSVTVG